MVLALELHFREAPESFFYQNYKKVRVSMWDLSKEIEEGIKRGMQKEKRCMIMRRLNLGVKDDDISIFTDAPLDLIEKVKSEMNYQEPKENYHYERNKA